MDNFTVAEIKAIANWCNDWLEQNQRIVLKEGLKDKYIFYDKNDERKIVKVSDIMSNIYALE